MPERQVKRIKTETLIIGAGPAGLSCAMELFKENRDFIVIEKQLQVGGLSKTYIFKEGKYIFRTDNGPHRFFSKNQALYRFIEEIINEKWIKVNRQTRQYINGKFYDYPINFFQALKNVGIFRAIQMGLNYFIARIQYGLFKKSILNFKDYIYANFGKTLGEFNMIHYTEKIWGIPSENIHKDWAAQRIKGLELFKILIDTTKKLFGLSNKNGPKSLVDVFYYPQFGTGLIYETIVNKIKDAGYKVFLGTNIIKIDHKDGIIKELTAVINGETVIFEFKNLVESVPINKFIQLLEPKSDNRILDLIKSLKYRSQVYLFITLDIESITKDQWIYFPDKSIPFARISEMRNFSSNMSPKGKTSLFLEFFCNEGDDLWNMNDKKIFNLALLHIEKIKLFKRGDVRNYYVLREKDVYPIYDLKYKEYLGQIKDYLNKFDNLYYIGRPGRFRYNNQDHSLEMGMLAAKSIIENIKYNIEEVGEEVTYQEKGELYEKRH